MNGDPTLLEIGGPSFLLPSVQRHKLYDIKELLNNLQYCKDSFVIGAGAGPWPYINSNCEVHSTNCNFNIYKLNIFAA